MIQIILGKLMQYFIYFFIISKSRKGVIKKFNILKLLKAYKIMKILII